MEIFEAIHELTGEVFTPGRLFSTLKDLKDRGDITMADGDNPETDPRKRYSNNG